jgi:hypothetical protein
MSYLNYKDLMQTTSNFSHKAILVDGPRRCATNYTRESISFMVENNIVLNHSDATHDPKIFIKNNGYLHNNNILHIIPIRNPRKVFVSAFLMYGYKDPDYILQIHQQLLTQEILNFKHYFNLEKKYKNTVLCPIEIFNNNENIILNTINNQYDLKLTISNFDREKVVKNLSSFKEKEYGENGLIKFHSYPIEEQKSEDYQNEKIFMLNLINKNKEAVKKIEFLSYEYDLFFTKKKKEWGV